LEKIPGAMGRSLAGKKIGRHYGLWPMDRQPLRVGLLNLLRGVIDPRAADGDASAIFPRGARF